MTLFYIFSVTFISSLISLLGSFFLARKKEWPKKFILQLTSFASGVLLATALLHLAPEAVETLDAKTVFTVIFISIIIFFVLERLMLWHHHHEEDDCCNPHPSAWFITFGDSMHNFLDGVLIAGAFLVNPSLGLLTAFAVSAHEIPQEIADFSIMVAGGMERKKALLLNLVSAMSAVVGALVTYFFAFSIEGISPYLIAFSAGMFLYIALSDLIPQLHNHGISDSKQKWNQMALFFIGILIIAGISIFLPDAHGHDEDHLHEGEQELLYLDEHEE